MQQYLFICTVGPVQDFIKTARRSRDLWYGSWMLSELSKAAAKAIGSENLIFPAPKNAGDLDKGSLLNVANKIVAKVETGDPKAFGDTVRRAAEERLREMRDAVLNQDRVRGNLDTTERAKKQVDDLLEFYWVAVPLPDEATYENVRDRAEMLLASRKNTRNFEQMEGANKPKSSLDGKLESVIHKDAYPKDNATDEERTLKAQSLYRRYGARVGEQLSGVDLMKRLGKPAQAKGVPKFHSTSHFAALPFIAMLDRELPIKYGGFLEEIRKIYLSPEQELDPNKKVEWTLANLEEDDIPNDGSLLYESRISDLVPVPEVSKRLRVSLNKVFEKHKVSQRPHPYYALLLADGDNMGKVINNQSTPEDHKSLSEKLSEFASNVPDVVRKYEGTAIYAGGDDILAYLPLHTALKCVKELDANFQDAMQDFTTKDGLHSTLSAGLVIAHHLTPLADVLEMAREAEKKAKEVKDKNGLVILSSKRSGEEKEIRGKLPNLVKRLEMLTDFHRRKAISKGTAYELQKLHHIFPDKESHAASLPEALRIIERKRESGSEQKIKDEIAEQFETWLKDKSLSLEELALEMMITTTFAAAKNMAEEKKKEEN